MEVDVKTRTLGLKDLKPCANCGGPINPVFKEVQIRTGVVDQRAVGELVGFQNMGFPVGIAEAMGAHASQPAQVVDEPTVLLLCQNCYCQPINLAALEEKLNDQQRREEEEKP